MARGFFVSWHATRGPNLISLGKNRACEILKLRQWRYNHLLLFILLIFMKVQWKWQRPSTFKIADFLLGLGYGSKRLFCQVHMPTHFHTCQWNMPPGFFAMTICKTHIYVISDKCDEVRDFSSMFSIPKKWSICKTKNQHSAQCHGHTIQQKHTRLIAYHQHCLKRLMTKFQLDVVNLLGGVHHS